MLKPSLEYAKNNKESFITEMKYFLSIPSISTNKENKADMQVAADWLKEQLAEAGMPRVEIISTERHPIVYAENLEAGGESLTVLIYGHYDVQRPDPLDDWDTNPFDPIIKEENLYARGAADNKGDICTAIAALKSIHNHGSLPINIKVLFEGEEEVGSGSVKKFIPQNGDLLAADFCLNLDSGLADYDKPAITYGLRGGVVFKLQVFGPKQALHSGIYGGLVQNPINVLSALIAKIHDEDGRITLPRFYDSVKPISAQEKEILNSEPVDEAKLIKEYDIPALWGDPDFTPIERVSVRPTCDVLKFRAGENKTAISASASASISFRMVADQDGEEIHQQFREFLDEHTPPTVTYQLDLLGGNVGSTMELDTPFIQAMRKAIESVWDKPAVLMRSGGSIPIVSMLQKDLGLDTVLTGITLPDANLHGPNEKIHLPTWEKGIQTLIHFFYLLAE